MKRKFLPIFILSASVGFFAFRSEINSPYEFHKSPMNSGGAAAGKTGAPGEQNCTACHSGTAQDGANENILTILNGTTPVTQYTPGQQYIVTLSMASNPTKKGFQATALTSSNVMAGAFTGQSGNTSISGTSKKYANHTASSNTSNTAPVWTWTWTAPAAGSGEVTFYVASNKTNNNGNDNGDVIYLSQHMISEASTTGIENMAFNNNVVIGSDNESNKVTVAYDLNQSSKMSLNILDLNGRSVFNKTLINGQIGKNHIEISTRDFNSGVYIVNFFIDNKPFSKRIIVR